MNRLLLTIASILLLISCEKETQNNLSITGNIDGLRKGTIYLQKVKDSAYVTIDSVVINGNANFTFTTTIESPEVYTLYLDKNDGNTLNDRLDFFAEPGAISIKTSYDYFVPEAIIEGSKTHDKWMEYKKILSKFSSKNLELIKENLEAQKDGKRAIADSLQQVADRNLTRSYLYTINFILNNKESFVAPYITLTNAYNVSTKYLDSINNSLPPEVAKSKYGKMLDTYIKNLKTESATTP